MYNKYVERNYGIDFLRALSMLFVVILHNLLEGGVLKTVHYGSVEWFGSYYLEDLAIVAVNVFAMITGYLSVGHRFRSKRIIDVVMQSVFWSAVIGIYLYLSGYSISIKSLLGYILPFQHYCYVKAYIGLMLIAPLLRKGIEGIHKQTLKLIVLLLLIISVLVDWGFNEFFLLQGYSSYWLIVMYLLGSYFALYPVKKHGRVLSGCNYTS